MVSQRMVVSVEESSQKEPVSQSLQISKLRGNDHKSSIVHHMKLMSNLWEKIFMYSILSKGH